MVVNDVMPVSRHGSRVIDLTYLTRIRDLLAGGLGLNLRKGSEAFVGTVWFQLTWRRMYEDLGR